MDQTIQLLTDVEQNARMGLEAVEQLMGKTQDEAVRQELAREIQVYQGIIRDAADRLYALGASPDRKNPAARAMAWMGIQMETAMDKSPSHIADLVIQGATMGVIEITKSRNTCPDADAAAQGVASEFIATQQDAIERMKAHLSFAVRS